MKALVRFGKSARLRFISHLDLQRTFQFALNRTSLPVAYSQGFTPHALMSFGSALAMGWVSGYEVFEFRTEQDVPADVVRAELLRALPPDLSVIDVRCVPNSRSATMALVKKSDYELTGAQSVFSAIPAFWRQTTVPVLRKSKSGEKEIDLLPLVYRIETDGTLLRTRLALSQTETARPELLVSALAHLAGVAAPAVSVYRTCLYGVDGRGRDVPVMEIDT